jgi:DNA (cytosine-5)-methyltransferase 1
VFVVGCLGNWRNAAEVLFESESLCRDIKPSREKRKETTSNSGIGVEITGPLAARRFAETDGLSEISAQMIAVPSLANCLQTTCHDWSRSDGFNMVAFDERNIRSFVNSNFNTFPSLCASDYKGAKSICYENHETNNNNVPLTEPISFDLAQITSKQNGTRVEPNLPVSTLAKGSQMHCAYSLQGAGVTSQNANGDGYKKEQSYTLNRTDVHGVAVLGGQHPNASINENLSPTLTNAMGAGGGHVPIIGNMAVRRLTPIECERLQGFPDNYTNIKNNCPDGPRYKALGNSMAVPVMKWIGERINDKS